MTTYFMKASKLRRQDRQPARGKSQHFINSSQKTDPITLTDSSFFKEDQVQTTYKGKGLYKSVTTRNRRLLWGRGHSEGAHHIADVMF